MIREIIRGNKIFFPIGAPHSPSNPFRYRRAWRLVVADESHTLHTPAAGAQAAHARTALALLRAAPRALLLSGTPSPRRPLDLFGQARAAPPASSP